MTRLTILGENGPSGFGPACTMLEILEIQKNILVDCGFAIQDRNLIKAVKALKKSGGEILDYEMPDSVKTALEMLMPELNKLGEDFYKNIIPPKLSLIGKEKIHAFLATHGHFDHIGATPLLGQFLSEKAKVFGAPQTLALISYLADDTMSHTSPSPFGLFDLFELEERYQTIPAGEGESEILPGLKIFAVPAGHIPGAASYIIKLPNGKKALVMSDTCWHDQPLLKGAGLLSKEISKEWLPDMILSTDLTYGAKEKKSYDAEFDRLEASILKVVDRGGKALVPAFMIFRGQNMAAGLARRLAKRGIPVFIDGGIRQVSDIFLTNRWSEKEEDFSLDGITFVENYRKERRDHRKELIESDMPMVIISTSGMGDFGWVRGRYLVPFLEEKDDAIFFVSHLASGSIGNKLMKIVSAPDGEEKKIDIDGKEIPVRAWVEKFELSSHGDMDQLYLYFQDICEARGDIMDFCCASHGTQENKQKAREVFKPFFRRIEVAETGLTMEI